MGGGINTTLNAQGSDGFFRAGNDDSYSNRDGITLNGLTTQDLGQEPAPLGSGLLIMVAAGAGYAVMRRKKSIKKYTTLIVALTMLLGMTQCKKNAKIVEPTIKNQVNITFSSGNGSKLSITENGILSWTSGDKIHVYSGTDGYLGSISTSDGTSFTGSIDAWTDGSDLYFYYLGTHMPTKDKDLKINFFDQSYSGTQSATNDLLNIANNFFVSRHVFPSVEASVTDFEGQMLNMVAVGIFNTAGFTDATTSNVKIYAASGLKNQITISSTGTMTYGVAGIRTSTDNQSGHIIIGPASAKRYVVLLPTNEETAANVDLMFTSNGMQTASAMTKEIAANSFICGAEATAITVSDVSAVSTANYVDLAVASKYEFTVASGKTVKFAKGNLVYDQGRFKMCKEQYGKVGLTSATVVSSTKVSGTFDYFGWGTSGWDNGNLLYMPYTYSNATSTPYINNIGNGYGPISGNNPYTTYNLIDEHNKADWGVYQFGMNTGSDWRTLTQSEWQYLIKTRTDAANKISIATVNGVEGTIILPDEWVLPDGVSFTGSAAEYSTNDYDSDEWTLMENNGAIFFPSIRYRLGTSINTTGLNSGSYWSSSKYSNAYSANDIEITPTNYGTPKCSYSISNRNKYSGCPVRLVRDVE